MKPALPIFRKVLNRQLSPSFASLRNQSISLHANINNTKDIQQLLNLFKQVQPEMHDRNYSQMARKMAVLQKPVNFQNLSEQSTVIYIQFWEQLFNTKGHCFSPSECLNILIFYRLSLEKIGLPLDIKLMTDHARLIVQILMNQMDILNFNQIVNLYAQIQNLKQKIQIIKIQQYPTIYQKIYNSLQKMQDNKNNFESSFHLFLFLKNVMKAPTLLLPLNLIFKVWNILEKMLEDSSENHLINAFLDYVSLVMKYQSLHSDSLTLQNKQVQHESEELKIIMSLAQSTFKYQVKILETIVRNNLNPDTKLAKLQPIQIDARKSIGQKLQKYLKELKIASDYLNIELLSQIGEDLKKLSKTRFTQKQQKLRNYYLLEIDPSYLDVIIDKQNQ